MTTAPTLPNPNVHSARQSGFSLAELMVGIAVGLIVTLVVVSTMGTMGLQRRTAVSGNDAKESGQAALNVMERIGRLAGTGLFYNGRLICGRINVYYNGATLLNGSVLMPVKITDGGSTGSDKVTFTYGSATGGHSISHLVDNMPNTSANFTVGNAGSLADGELAVVGVPDIDRPCTLFQVTGFPPGGGNCNNITSSCVDVQHNSGIAGPYNPSNPNNAFTDAPNYGYETSGSVIGPAVISRIGTFHNDTYEVLCNSLVSHAATSTASCNGSPVSFTNATPWVSNIVMIKAQYGISDNINSDVVTQWVNASDTAWSNPGAADVPRIRAIRIAVVGRSPEAALSEVTSACTNQAGVANTGPCAFQDADSPVINLTAVPVVSGKSWRNYRYRVYQSVIPLRNVLWNY
ncbi:PilW family protein [Herbaspirillum sp. ST 5-3]|uniref:PilW family protein n=1 Tax=Oxalobacteraceae TaxID=75682 RepID=UPI0010A3FCAB|nr:PilW family protein [Herbaspirillum sp. ST 5-3]